MPHALVGLGSNLGDRQANLQAALDALAATPGITLLAGSAVHETQPIGGPVGQDLFLNSAALLETSLPPEKLLHELNQIENRLGRTRNQRWSARTLDLDLLLYEGVVLETSELTIPHPRMAFRRFALQGAAEIAPEMVHPIIGWTVRQLWEHLNTAPPYVAITGVYRAENAELLRRLRQEPSGSVHCATWPCGDSYFLPTNDIPAADQADALLRAMLDDCRRALHADSWPRYTLVVSDFWFDQLPAMASLYLAGQLQERFEHDWHAARREVIRPKLIVWLDAPVASMAGVGEGRAGADLLVRFGAALEQRIRGPDVGPWLHLDAIQLDNATSEVLASIQAM